MIERGTLIKYNNKEYIIYETTHSGTQQEIFKRIRNKEELSVIIIRLLEKAKALPFLNRPITRMEYEELELDTEAILLSTEREVSKFLKQITILEDCNVGEINKKVYLEMVTE